jgi:hypothetical protein
VLSSKLLIALLLFASSLEAAAQVPLASPATRRYGKLLFIEATVNETGPFWFAFDSGAHDTLVDPFIVQQAHIALKQATSTITGTGEGEVSVAHANPIALEIQNLRLNIADPLVIDVSSADVPKWVHGIIGAALLDSYAVEVDPDKPSLLVFEASNYHPPKGASNIPLIAENHRYFLMAKLEVNDKIAAEHKLRIDTGSEDSVGDEILKSSAQHRTTSLGHGFGENYVGESGVFRSVTLGPFTFHDVWGPAVPNPTVGMEIFRRFTTIFDVPQRALYLVPNNHFQEPIPPPGG